MVLIEDLSCVPNCDESYKGEWANAAAKLKSQLSNQPAVLMGTLNKESIDSDSDLVTIFEDITKYPTVKIFGCDICPAAIKQFTDEITEAGVIQQATKLAAFNNPVISLDDDIFEPVTDLPSDGSVVPYVEGSDFSWIIAVKKVPCSDCVSLEGTMNAMASDVATRTDNQVKMAVIDADVNPLLSDAFSGDSNPTLWIVKPDGNKVDVSSKGSKNNFLASFQALFEIQKVFLRLRLFNGVKFTPFDSFNDPFPSIKTQSEIAGLADALKKSMDEDKVVTPIDENTLQQTTGFDGTKSKESASLSNL